MTSPDRQERVTLYRTSPTDSWHVDGTGLSARDLGYEVAEFERVREGDTVKVENLTGPVADLDWENAERVEDVVRGIGPSNVELDKAPGPILDSGRGK